MNHRAWLLAASLALLLASPARADEPAYSWIDFRYDFANDPSLTWQSYPKTKPLDAINVQPGSWSAVDVYGLGVRGDGPLTKELDKAVARAIKDGEWRSLPANAPGPEPRFTLRIAIGGERYQFKGSIAGTKDPLVRLLDRIRGEATRGTYEIGLPGEKVKSPPPPPSRLEQRIRAAIGDLYMKWFVNGTSALFADMHEIWSEFKAVLAAATKSDPPKSEGMSRVLEERVQERAAPVEEPR